MKIGDVVRLKGGGPKMTLNGYQKDGIEPLWDCVWFDSEISEIKNVCCTEKYFEMRKGRFTESALEEVK